MTITDFLRYVLPGISGVPTPLARQAVIDAATEFLTETKVWDEIQGDVTLVDGAPDYDLDAPSGGRCIDLKEVYAFWAPDGRLRGVTMSQLAREMPNWQTAQGSLPSHYTRAFDYSSVRVFPTPKEPTADAVIRMHGVYTLREDATAIPDEIVRRWREPIAAGARARLLITSKDNPWRDLDLGQYEMRRFREGISEAQIYAEHSKTTGAVTVPPIRFGY